jgi:hypothetical protein
MPSVRRSLFPKEEDMVILRNGRVGTREQRRKEREKLRQLRIARREEDERAMYEDLMRDQMVKTYDIISEAYGLQKIISAIASILHTFFWRFAKMFAQ